MYSAYGCGFNWGGLPSAAINLVWLNLNRSRAAAAATRLGSSATIAHVCSNAAVMLDIWCQGRTTIERREMRGWSIGGDDVVQHILLRQPSLGARAGLVTICGHDRDTFIYASLIYLTPPSTLKLLLPHPLQYLAVSASSCGRPRREQCSLHLTRQTLDKQFPFKARELH